jgi:putative transposase
VRIQGECRKLGIRVGASMIKRLLLREGLGPASRRVGSVWSEFLRSQAEGSLAFDFFTTQTVFLRQWPATSSKALVLLAALGENARPVRLGLTSLPTRG